MPSPPPTLHLACRARAQANEARFAALQSLAALEESRLLLSRPVYPLHPDCRPPARDG